MGQFCGKWYCIWNMHMASVYMQKTADKNTEAYVSFLYDHLCVMHASAVCILWIITHQYCINGMSSSDVFHALQAAV